MNSSNICFNNQANAVEGTSSPVKKPYALMTFDELFSELRLEGILYKELKNTFSLTKGSEVTTHMTSCAKRRSLLRRFMRDAANPEQSVMLSELEAVKKRLNSLISDHVTLQGCHEKLKNDYESLKGNHKQLNCAKSLEIAALKRNISWLNLFKSGESSADEQFQEMNKLIALYERKVQIYHVFKRLAKDFIGVNDYVALIQAANLKVNSNGAHHE